MKTNTGATIKDFEYDPVLHVIVVDDAVATIHSESAIVTLICVLSVL